MVFKHHYPLVNVYKKLWKDPPCFMGKLTISTGPCSSSQTVSHYQRVNIITVIQPKKMVISQEDMEHWTTIFGCNQQEQCCFHGIQWPISGWYTHSSSLTLCNGISPVLNLPSCNVKMYRRLLQHQQYGFNRPKLGCLRLFFNGFFFPGNDDL